VSDSQVLGDLLNQIPQDEQIESVYTDGAYDTKQCRQNCRQAHAVIPPKKCETLERYKDELARAK
jgi:inhibitor of KinA sporulation pathway (predicted exonuclease)